MHEYFLRNLSELAVRRAIALREDAQLWDILARDLKREAGRIEERLKERPIKPSQKSESQLQENGQRINVKLFVRISEAAKMMGIGRSSLYNEISASRITVRKAGRNTLIAVSEIQAWFDRLPLGID